MASARSYLHRAARPNIEDLIDRFDETLHPEVTVDSSDSEENHVEEEEVISDESFDDSIDNDDLRDDEESHSNNSHFVDRENRIWLRDPPVQVGRRSGRHIVREVSGPTRHASTDCIENCLNSFITDEIVNLICDMTNRYASHWIREHGNWYGERYYDVDVTEMKAFFGCLLLAGVFHSKGESYEQLWSSKYGRCIFGAIMSLSRFQIILKFIRFDEKETRSERSSTDKMAACRQLWELFIRQCRKNYTLSEYITIDEQLMPFRGRCSFRVYMSSKPDKYGIKIWSLCDSNTAYLWNAEVYLGKSLVDGREVGQGQRVVETLSEPLIESSRNITTDNFFTSYELAQSLLQKNLSLLGTLRSNKRCIPNEFLKNRSRAQHSSLFGFHEQMTLCSYVPRKGNAVVLLSTLHSNAELSDREDQKPVMILNYNETKGAVDTLDQCIHGYSCARQSRRWSLRLFFHILDLSAWNAYVVWIQANPQWNTGKNFKRRLFLIDLGESLVRPHIQRRWMTPSLNTIVRNRMMQTGMVNLSDRQVVPDAGETRGRCFKCQVRRLSRTKCSECRNFVCPDHQKVVCSDCE